jgi:MFS family permease
MPSSSSAERPPFLGLPRPFRELFLATLVNRLGGFVVPFLALFLGAERNMEPRVVGLIVASYGAGSILAGPVGGWLADRLGRKRTIVAGMAATAAAITSVMLARHPVALGIACFALGAAADGARPAMNALVADIVPAELRPKAYSALYWAANLGFSCAALLGGFASVVSFDVLFVVDAATCLACAAIVHLRVPEPARAGAGERTGSVASLLVPFRNAAFIRFFFASLLVALVFLQFQVAMPLDMKEHGVSTGAYGALVATNGVLVITLQPVASPLMLRIPRRTALAISALLTGIGFGLLGFVSSVPGYAVAITVFTLGEVAMAGVNPTFVSELSPPSLRGTYQGAWMLSFSLAAFAAPLLGGTLLGAIGSRNLWLGCFAVGVLAAAVHLTGVTRRAEQPCARGC